MMYSLPTRMVGWFDSTTNCNFFEEKLKYEKSRGMLCSQKLAAAKKKLYTPVPKLGGARTVMYGNPYQIINRDFEKDCLHKKNYQHLCLAGTMNDLEVEKYGTLSEGCQVMAINTTSTIMRNTFSLESSHPCYKFTGNIIYEESVYIKTVGTEVPLYVTFMESFLTLGHMSPVTLTLKPTVYSKFKISFWKPDTRSTKFRTIEVDQRLIIKHSATGKNLVLTHSRIPTVFGSEYEVTCDTLRDTHKMETAENFWVIL